MKIVAISDTHGQHGRLVIPTCDVLIHAGDASNYGLTSELDKFFTWFRKQPAKHKLFVPGNHDIAFQKGYKPKGVDVLIDRAVTIDGIKFYGSPWVPKFHNWAFMLPRGCALAEKWQQIPEDTEVLVTHSPAFGTLDDNKGCEDLALRLKQLPSVKLHIFGHIHEGAGETERNDRISVNAAMTYLRVARDPVELDFSGTK